MNDLRPYRSGRGGAPGATPAPLDVLHVINGEFFAGAERVQDLLAGRLPQFGYRAHFVCLKRGQFQQVLEQGPHPSQVLEMRSRLDVARHALSIARYARDTGCRLIHTHTTRSALVGSIASAIARLPLVHHEHSPKSRDSARRLFNVLNAGTERAAMVRASIIIAVSESLAGYLRRQGVRDEHIVTIPNGVAIQDTPPVGIPHRGDRLSLGTVALFRPRKGIEVLLKAMARLIRQGQDVELAAIGPFETPAYEHDVRRLCRELGLENRVEWRGFRQDVAAELRRVDLLALPSLFGEGMPMVVLEAMAVGLPVLASRVEGVPEVVRDGTDGLLVEAGDERALADAMARLAGDPSALARMGAAGRRRQQEEFSDLAMAERVSRVYDELLGVEGTERPAGSEDLAKLRVG